jgi:membrane protein
MTLKRASTDSNERAAALLAPWEHILRPRLERARVVLSFAARRAGQARLTEVAGSLTFSTVLSLVPLLAVALALFIVFPQFGDLRDSLEKSLLRSLLHDQLASTIVR